jgi:hypothetical protein
VISIADLNGGGVYTENANQEPVEFTSELNAATGLISLDIVKPLT